MEGRKRLGIPPLLNLNKLGLEGFSNFGKQRGLISNKKERKLFKPIKGKLRAIDEKLHDICSNLDSIHEKINKRLDLIENRIIKKLEHDNYYAVDQLCHIEQKLINLEKEIIEDSEDEDEDEDEDDKDLV